MNISSLIVNLKNANLTTKVSKAIETIKECEVITTQDDKIVVVVTTPGTDEQIAIFRSIEAIIGVDSVGMVYNYEELDDEIAKMKEAPKTSQILDDDFDPKDVIYSGSIHHKTR